MKILSIRASVYCHNILVPCPTKSGCQTTYVMSSHWKVSFFPHKTIWFKHVLLSSGFTSIPFPTSQKKFRGCQWSVKWQLWHQMLQGENAVMDQYWLNNVSYKEERVGVTLYLKDTKYWFLPEHLTDRKGRYWSRKPDSSPPQTEGDLHFFTSRNKGCHNCTEMLFPAQLDSWLSMLPTGHRGSEKKQWEVMRREWRK